MNDAQQQTSADVDGNDSDVDSDDDVPMGLWGAVTAAGVGDGGGAGVVCSVFCGLRVLFITPHNPNNTPADYMVKPGIPIWKSNSSVERPNSTF